MPTRREFLCDLTAAGAALAAGVVVSSNLNAAESSNAPPSAPATGRPGRLLVTIDCTQEFPPDRYFAHGKTHVAQSSAGRYREAAGNHSSRFGYRFRVKSVGRPHVAVIHYPDDKRRYMCIMDGTTYDLSTGVFTGWAQPISNRMLELRQVFWPRWTDCTITFLTWGAGEPAAVSRIDIFELDELPALPRPTTPGQALHREIGIQYEDPCGTGCSEGAMTRDQWLDHLVAYMRHTGQGLLVYPLAWYHGPQFPSQREPADGFDTVVGPDRKQYVRWTTQPADWYAGMLERFGREGLAFQGSLTLLRLGSLMQKMNTDLEAIKGGAETFNNLMWNNQVQSSPNDWTARYNVRNFTQLIEYETTGRSMRAFPWAYGERAVPGGHGAPMFNPLHPVVQEAVIGFASEIATRYARYPAFQGISLNLWHATIVWFASLHAGYDDFTVKLFEKETAIKVPIDPKAADRFSKRYAFLQDHCRPAWIDWRCRKIHDFLCQIRDALVAARKDLRLTLTLWDETTIPQLLGWCNAATQLHARPSTVDLYRCGGLDLSLYRREQGIELDLGMGNTRDRGGHPYHSTDGVNAPIEAQCMYRDHDFLDSETLCAMSAQDRPGAFIFNCWVESWGEHKWFPCEPGEPQPKELAVMDGRPAEGIFRINSIYPKDGFWWDSQLRITPAFPAGVHFMEPYAHALAEFDSLRITRGGLFLDKAHSEEIRRFAAAYRVLPKEKFETVGPTTDPVAVRTLVRDGRRWFYIINRDYYPIRMVLRFARSPGKATDLSSGEVLRPSRSWEVILGPYELHSFTVAADVAISGFTAYPPAEIAATLLADAQKALKSLETNRSAGNLIPGLDQMQRDLESAVAEKRLAWLRRALTSYIVRKSAELAGQITAPVTPAK